MANIKYRVELTAEERTSLLELVNKGKAPATQIKHAHILLAVDRSQGEPLMSDTEAAKAYFTTQQTVLNVKRRFIEEGFESSLQRKKREKPSKVKLDGKAEARIVALTCTDPPEGHARWTLRLIAEKSVELGYVDSISHVAIRDLLKKTNCSHGWLKNGASPNNQRST